MKTILVPTDFSKAANNAAEYAIHLAKDMNASVLLLHVYHLPLSASGEIPVMTIAPKELQEENMAELKRHVAQLKVKTGVEVNYKAKMGMAVDEILEEEKNAKFIVMGMRGAGKLSELLIGSITTATLSKATTPVLVIPEDAVYQSLEKIVFACDYDPETDTRTLDALKALTKTFNSKIFVVNVKKKSDTLPEAEILVGEKIEKKLHGIEHVFYFPENKDLVEGINEFVENKNADMVAVIPHRYNAIERLFHKSISKKMAFHTRVPLLVLPDNQQAVAGFFI